MPTLSNDVMERYLSAVFGRPAVVRKMTPLGEVSDGDSIKMYGYGKPVRIDFQVDGEPLRSAVFHTCAPNSFGHEHMADRARDLLWAHQAFNHLPRHTVSLDVGGWRAGGEIAPLGDVEEFCQLTGYVPGDSYHLDLERISREGSLSDADLARADALCDYLAEIHARRGMQTSLYARRIRELVGHGECIMGLADSYPADGLISPALLEEIEVLCVRWRWKLKPLTHRLCQVHGDFHPWNILFDEGGELHVLDRSRGEWGDAADDVTSLTANYLFFSLRGSGELEGPFATLFQRFWERYLERTGDREMLRVVAPYYTFRCMVMASPVWYPSLADAVRQKLIHFAMSLLNADEFDPKEVNVYCAGA